MDTARGSGMYPLGFWDGEQWGSGKYFTRGVQGCKLVQYTGVLRVGFREEDGGGGGFRIYTSGFRSAH
jgi:hypothetical protein